MRPATRVTCPDSSWEGRESGSCRRRNSLRPASENGRGPFSLPSRSSTRNRNFSATRPG
ncbi:hypothetical protein OPAG_00570 [Rhodococcus opacus PD630]|nr:hypothetical protein Pd630_LPD06191 [Rhodococcus opacus PD630]EHI40683.1 hypothetical protein OPAG_00570 [Rhodococcus opacus PD630]